MGIEDQFFRAVDLKNIHWFSFERLTDLRYEGYYYLFFGRRGGGWCVGVRVYSIAFGFSFSFF